MCAQRIESWCVIRGRVKWKP